MIPVEGISLSDEIAAARSEILDERRKAVRKAINGILLNIRTWDREIDTAQNTIRKREDAIAKAQAKLMKLEAGDWSVLSEEAPRPRPEQATAD